MSCFERVKSISENVSDMTKLIVVSILMSYDLVCTIYCGWPFSDFNTISNPYFRNSVAMSVCHICMGIIIASWVYSAPRVVQWDEDIEKILYSLTGERKTNNQNNEAGILYSEQIILSKTCPSKDDSALIKTIKHIYIFLWFVFIIGLSCLFLPYKLGHIKIIPIDGIQSVLVCIQGCITWIIGVVCMTLCMHSWWYSMEYGYFLSKVSRMANIKNYNNIHPSQTHALKRLLHTSTMLSTAFLVTSALLAVQYVAVFVLDGPYPNSRIINNIWMLLILIPGVCSLIPMVVLPKLFIIRIHRKWKMGLIKKYEARLRNSIGIKNIDELFSTIDTINNDKIDFHYFEVIGAVITVILHFGMLLATIMIND